jgi:hypothetical protein
MRSRPGRLQGVGLVGSLMLGVYCALAFGVAPAGAAEACANGSLRGGLSVGLPDCRAYELVSPAEKNGGSAGVSQGFVQDAVAAADGSAIFYGDSSLLVTNNYGASENGAQFFSVSSRSAGGWGTRGVLPAPTNQVGASPQPIDEALPSADVSQVAINTIEAELSFTPLTTGPAAYLFGPGGSTQWLSKPDISEGSAGDTLIDGASADLSRIYFSASGTLLPSDTEPNPAFGGASRQSVGGSANTGFYEWTPTGGLSYAGVLPNGSVDPYGVLPAGFPCVVCVRFVRPQVISVNQVSSDGSRAFFVSPSPLGEAPASDPPELYVRETAVDGSQRTVLVSGSALTGQPAADSPLRGVTVSQANGGGTELEGGYIYASPDGSHVFFEDVDALTADAPSDGSVKEYEFDTETNTLSYLPGFTGKILTSSTDGSRVLYVDEETESLDLWSGSQATTVAHFPAVGGHLNDVLPDGRVSADGSVFVFQTSSPVYSQSPGQFNNGGGFQEVYRYVVASGQLSCLSCGSASLVHTGDANMSNDTFVEYAMADNRAISSDGSRVFFDTPDALVPQDVNGRRDVYEWEEDGSGSCVETGGCLYLVSSGESEQDSYFLDNSASGDDVFFATTQGLVPQDSDGAYDIYDARVGGGFAEQAAASVCSEEACQGTPAAPPSLSSPASVTFSGPGNAVGGGGGASGVLAPVKAQGGVVRGSTFSLAVQVPGPGRVTLAGAGVKSAAVSFAVAGSYRVRVALTAGERRALKRRRKLKLTLRVVYAPAGGASSSVTVSITDKA